MLYGITIQDSFYDFGLTLNTIIFKMWGKWKKKKFFFEISVKSHFSINFTSFVFFQFLALVTMHTKTIW